jgi:hypothetical protein
MIADEKVRGKRLVVRCKRCGAKITISDPALAAAAHKPAPASAPAPVRKMATPGEVDHRPRDSDTERTRAMDSEVLEKAVQASKRDEPLVLETGAARSVPPTPAPPREPAIWFAMLAGKQTGPLTRAELDEKTAQGRSARAPICGRKECPLGSAPRSCPSWPRSFPSRLLRRPRSMPIRPSM